MTTCNWWIDEPLLRGSSNPSDEDFAQLYAQGFSVAVSLLEESIQPPRYDKESAQSAGWSIHSIPIEERCAPALDQIREFTAQLEALPPGAKVLVFCESGLGRTAFIGAVYWIMKGLTASDAIARVSEACGANDWVTEDRRRILDDYDRLRRIVTRISK